MQDTANDATMRYLYALFAYHDAGIEHQMSEQEHAAWVEELTPLYKEMVAENDALGQCSTLARLR